MDIAQIDVTVGDLVTGFSDDGDGGVRAFGGDLDVRPAFQREFVYDDKQRTAVIESVVQGYPMNAIYWADRGEGSAPRYEIIDGQQRTISLCQYATGDFSFPDLLSHHALFIGNLTADQRQAIMEYPLTVYVCSGTDNEKLRWFETINIAGEVLTRQELRNAVYSGTWVTDAKRWFSRRNCQAERRYGRYVSGSPIRQELLEQAIKWAAGGGSDEAVTGYMAQHQHDPDSADLWEHFQVVMDWVQRTFPDYQNPMRKVDWGTVYDDHKNDTLHPEELAAEVSRLLADEDVQSGPGIYRYVLDRDERHLNLRRFTERQKQRAHARQNGVCPPMRHQV